MKFGLMGRLFSAMFGKTVYGYTAKAVPGIDIRAFRKRHLKEYRAMVARTPAVGSMKENMFRRSCTWPAMASPTTRPTRST